MNWNSIISVFEIEFYYEIVFVEKRVSGVEFFYFEFFFGREFVWCFLVDYWVEFFCFWFFFYKEES